MSCLSHLCKPVSPPSSNFVDGVDAIESTLRDVRLANASADLSEQRAFVATVDASTITVCTVDVSLEAGKHALGDLVMRTRYTEEIFRDLKTAGTFVAVGALSKKCLTCISRDCTHGVIREGRGFLVLDDEAIELVDGLHTIIGALCIG